MRQGFTKFISVFFKKINTPSFKELHSDKDEIQRCKEFLENLIMLQLHFLKCPREFIYITLSKDENYFKVGGRARYYQHLKIIKFYLEDKVKIPAKELEIKKEEIYGDIVEADQVLYCPIDQIVSSEVFKNFLESGIQGIYL